MAACERIVGIGMRSSNVFRLLAPISSLVAQQLSHPRGWLGKRVMTRVLNRGNRELIRQTLAQLQLTPQTRLLDVGFGGGLSLRLAREQGVVRLVGVDPSLAAVESLKETSPTWVAGAELRILQGGVDQLPLADAEIDAIISTNTVYFWSDLMRAFSELRRVLAPAGVLALGFSSSEKLRSFSTLTRHGFLYHDDATLLKQAREAGFLDVGLTALTGGSTEGDRILVAHARP